MVLPNSDYIKIIVGVDVVPYIHLIMKKFIREVIQASYLLKLRKVRAWLEKPREVKRNIKDKKLN